MGGTDGSLEGAGHAAKQQSPKFSPERFLEEIERGNYIEVDFEGMPAAQRDLVLPALRAMASERGGAVRLNAARALLGFGDPLGSKTLVECLQSEDADSRCGALDRLILFGHNSGKHYRELPIDKDILLIALGPSIADSNRGTRERAMFLMRGLKTPRGFDRLTELLSNTPSDVRADAAIGLALSGYDRGALAVIDEMLLLPPDLKRFQQFVAVLRNLCEQGDAATRARAADIAIQLVQRNLRSGHQVSGHVLSCLDGIAAAQAPGEADLLREVIASNVGWLTRGGALKRLAQLEGRRGITRLLSALSDSELRAPALESLISLADGSSDPTVVAALAQEIEHGSGENISALVRAFIAYGGRTRSLGDEIVERLDRETQMTVRWLRQDIGPREAAAKLQPACGGAELSQAILDKLEAEWCREPEAICVIYSILGTQWNRLTGFDCEDVVSPADHTNIVSYLAEITADQFTADDEVEQTIEASGDLKLTLTHRGREYSFTLENHGSWCNLPGILNGLNHILDQVTIKERFVSLCTDGQTGVVVFALPDEFLSVARELCIKLESTSAE